MSNHVHILAVCFFVYFGFLALIGILAGAWIILIGGLLFGEHEAFAGGGYLALLAIMLSLPGLIAAIGLLKFHRWARIAAISYGVVNMVVFPVGTALGIYALWVLLSHKSWALFETER